MVYSNNGLNEMIQTFHQLYRNRLVRGYWRDRERPILINNWEATYFDFDFDEEKKFGTLLFKRKTVSVMLIRLID